MTKIKLLITSLIVSCLFFVAGSVFAGPAEAAPRLYFDPSPTNVANGSDVTIKVQIDVENNSAFGADAVINFPSADLTLKSVVNGGFFSDFSYAPSSGQIELHGYFSVQFQSKTGNGTFASIVLTGIKNSGSGNLTFTCSGSGNDTEILDSNGNNILSCTNVNQDTITYGSAAGEPNACGGTCGSNYNCQGNFFCSQDGFCRNPLCPGSVDCSCKTPTPAPTKAPTKVFPSPTMEVVVLAPFSSKSGYFKTTPTPTSNLEATLPPQPANNLKYLLYIAGGAIILAIILFIIGTARKNK